jgi:hypothetical protein
MKLSNILTGFFLAFTFGCANAPDKTAELKKENARLRQEIDSLKNEIRSTKTEEKTGNLPVGRQGPEDGQPAHEVSANKERPKDGVLRPGRHDFTLQWISWDEPGSVEVRPAADGWYSIKGGQKNRKNSDHITIDGLIKQVSETELLFKGEIRSVVASNNKGEPCVKKGEYIFKTTKNRKYWRMSAGPSGQDMINCEGGLLTDYVDIYF